MEAGKFFKKKWADKLVCQVCGSKNFQSICIYDDEGNGRVRWIDLKLYCEFNHVCKVREYSKPDILVVRMSLDGNDHCIV